MRKNYLRVLSLAAILSVAAVPTMAGTVYADEPVPGIEETRTDEPELLTATTEYTEGNFKYTVSDGSATITGLVDPDISKSINLVIPAKIGNYTVKAIAERAFEGNNNIKSVTFNKGLEIIGRAAFKNCVNLSGKVTIPSTVTWIRGGDLYWNDSWGNRYTDSLDNKGGAFYGTSVTELVVEDSNAKLTIGASAFENCVNLQTVSLTNRVTSIDAGAFRSDSGLTSLSILEGNNPVTIGTNSFAGCANLSSISLGKGVSVIGAGAFYNTAVENMVFPDTVTTIGMQAFESCKLLTGITLNEGLTTIGRAAFKGCSLLEGTLTIPSTVTEIYGGNLNSWGDASDYTSSVESKGGAFYGTGIEELVIKDGTAELSIGASAFESCKSLTKVIIPNRCTYIGEGSFRDDVALTELIINEGSNNVTVGTDAFRECSSLVNVSLGEGVTTLEFGAFQVTAVETMVFPSTIKSIGSAAFYNCTSLHSIILNEGLETIGNRAFAYCAALSGKLVIPSTVTDIYGYKPYYSYNTDGGAFYKTGYTSVEVKDGNAPINIGPYTFNGCTELRSASLSNRVSSIGEGAFMNTPLVWVKISNGNHTMTIGDSAFKDCTELQAISLPKNVTSVGKNSFDGCVSFTDVYYAGTQKQYNALCTSTGTGNDVYSGAEWHYESAGPDSWPDTSYTGWKVIDGVKYWYEKDVRQGLEGRGKEIFDPESDAWYWLDSVLNGAVATSKDVYQESEAGQWGDYEKDGVKMGKWVRYDENGHMIKGWQTTEAGTYYFDAVYGTMAKGEAVIDGKNYYFDVNTGILCGSDSKDDNNKLLSEDGWHKVNGVNYWYEGGVRQGYDPNNSDYRGKEIYDAGSDAWYWLDNVQDGAVAKSKDVYQESLAGEWGDRTNEAGERIGKWVRYDANGHMIKGWSKKDGNTYYFDETFGTMAKGEAVIDGKTYYFDVNTGILQQ